MTTSAYALARTAAVLLLVPGLAWAQDADKLEPYTVPTKETAKPAQEAGKGPPRPMGVKGITPHKKAFAEEKLEEAIQTLKQLIETTDEEDPSRPEYLARLAQVYWDKAEMYFSKANSDEIFKRLLEAQEKGDEAAVAAIKAEQNAYLRQRKFWQQRAVDVYMSIVAKYPEYPGLDEVLYFLGFTLVQMEKEEEAYQYFARLIRDNPQSRYAPDAILNIAEYHYNKGQFEQALKAYSVVEKFPDSAAYGLAIFKKGWCHFNLHDYKQAMNQFLHVIEYARSDRGETIGYSRRLLSEAQRDLVMVYSQFGSPQNAIEVFKKIDPKGYLTLAVRLAEGYASQGQYKKSTMLFKRLIAAHRHRPDSYEIIGFQRHILENAYHLGIAARVAEETRRLAGLLKKLKDKAPKDYYQREMSKAEGLIGTIAYNYHKEVQVTKDQQSMEFTRIMYQEYLDLFPQFPQAEKMRLNYARLLTALGRYDAAADIYFEIAKHAKGDLALEAAKAAVANYYNMIDVRRKQAKSVDTTDLEPKAIPEDERKLLDAAERYLRLASKKGEDGQVVEARFAAALVYYDRNHFKEAAENFRYIVEHFPDHQNAPDAARLLLSSLHLMRDIKGLNAVADYLSHNPKLMRGEVPELVKKIREQADFNRCYEFEQQARYKVAAECFLAYVERFKDTPLRARALINAGNNFFRARLVEKALEVNLRLYKDMSNSPQGIRALFTIGEIYRRLAVYSEAARFYEIFVKAVPKHKLTEQALKYAIILRMDLRDYDKAAQDMWLYLKLFPKTPHAQNLGFQIGLMYERGKHYRRALAHFRSYVRRSQPASAPDDFLMAHLRIAKIYEALGSKRRASEAYAATVDAYTKLPDEVKKKATAAGLAAVAEARFMQGESILGEVRKIELRPPKARLTKAIGKKLQLIKTAMDVFTDVQAFGQPHWSIAALSRKGLAFQELATAIENVPPPRSLSPEARELFKDGLFRTAAPLWERAKKEYKLCVETAKRLKWFNKYSEEAEDALMRLDPAYQALPDIRPSPRFYHLNVFRPRLLPHEEGGKPPEWDDQTLAESLKRLAQARTATAVDVYNYGAFLEANGRLDEAKKLYAEASKMKGRLADPLARLGLLELRAGNTKQAEEYFSEALQRDPANAVVHDYKGAKALAARNYQEAINHARMALVSDPDNMDAYLNLAATYYEMGLLDEGKLVCRNALSLKKKNAPIKNMLALIFLKKDAVSDAVAVLMDALKDDPNFFDARANLGAVTLAYKDFEAALTHLRKAVELDPKSSEARLGLAVALRNTGRAKEALAILQQLLDERPNLPGLHFNLCVLYQENLQDLQRAKQECQAFLERAAANHPRVKQAKVRLEGIETMLQAQEPDQAQEQGKEGSGGKE